MTDFGTEYDSTIQLTIDKYRKLQSHEPNNPLLTLIEVTNDSFSYATDPPKRAEYFKKYNPEEKEPALKVWVAYLVDLIREVDRIEGTNSLPSPKPTLTPVTKLDDIKFDEDDIPF